MIIKRTRKIVKLTVGQVADYLEMWARELARSDFEYSDFYCGIGKDMDERAKWHNTDNLMSIETDSRESAGNVEEEMSKRGFDTGARPDNGGTEESCFVYIYPKTPDTRETAD